jgi:hypothetical protein
MRCLALIVLLLPCIFAQSGQSLNPIELLPQNIPSFSPSNRPPGFYPFPPETQSCCDDAPWISRKLLKLNDNLFEIDQNNSIVFKRLSEIFDEVKAFETTQVEVDQYIIGTKIEIYQNGIKGMKGYQGVRGEQGAPGHPGSPGLHGPVGKTGDRGVPGNQGQPGRKGGPGARGFQGPIGKVGPPGQLDDDCHERRDGSHEDKHKGHEHKHKSNEDKHKSREHDRDDNKDGLRFRSDKKQHRDDDENMRFGDDEETGAATRVKRDNEEGDGGDWGWSKCAPPGERGPHGPQGAQGPTGAPGPHGHKGPKGYRGRAGHKGGRGADCCIFGEADHPEWAEPEW